MGDGSTPDSTNRPNHRNLFAGGVGIFRRIAMPRSDPNRTLDDLSVDAETIREALEEHPVRLAVLFGSAVTGRTHPRSDLDLAVEFEDSVDSVGSELLSLTADLMTRLDRDDIDLSAVSDIKSRIGLSAFSEGILVVGADDRMTYHRGRFERAVEEQAERRDSLRERFDSVIEGVDTALGLKS